MCSFRSRLHVARESHLRCHRKVAPSLPVPTITNDVSPTRAWTDAQHRSRRYRGWVDDTDAIVERILVTYDTITVVGASAAPEKAAHSVPGHMQQHGWRIIPINPHADEILREPVYRTLAEVPEQVGLVDVFRPSLQAPDIARQAVAAGASALWLQLGIASEEARHVAEIGDMLYVEDRCLIIEQRRLGLRAPSSFPRVSVAVCDATDPRAYYAIRDVSRTSRPRAGRSTSSSSPSGTPVCPTSGTADGIRCE
jgi:uncharacterized protein